MSDVEMVLRYFTLLEKWENFNGDYRASMDTFMEKNRNANKAKLKELKERFTKSLSRCQKLWGNAAFHRFVGSVDRDQFLAAVYDAEMIAVSSLSSTEFNSILANKAKLKTLTTALFKDKEFEQSIRVSTNTPRRIKYRISRMLNLLNSCI